MSQLSQARLPLQAAARLPANGARWLLCALLAATLLAPITLVRASGLASELIGQPAPDFALRAFSGDNLRLSEHTGEVVLINFWATWCGPCRQEMPLLDEIYAKYRRAGLVLLSINLDEDRAPAEEMARALKVSYPVLFDARKEVSRSYQAGNLPLTVLIDRAGVVRYVSDGYKPGYEARYTEKLRELLNE